MRSGTTPLVLLGCTFACLQWLRWLEVPGVDQSLFVAYGRWLGRGLVLYRDLWDSKPPGLFWAYAIAERVMGTGPAPRLLDAAAAVASAVLAYLLLRSVLRDAASSAARRAPVSSAVAPWVGAFMTAFLPADPCFGLLRTAAQPEVLSTPLVEPGRSAHFEAPVGPETSPLAARLFAIIDHLTAPATTAGDPARSAVA